MKFTSDTVENVLDEMLTFARKQPVLQKARKLTYIKEKKNQRVNLN